MLHGDIHLSRQHLGGEGRQYRGQDHPRLHDDFEAFLCYYMRPYLDSNKIKGY